MLTRLWLAMIALTLFVLAACNVATSREVGVASATSTSTATADLPLASVQVESTETSGVVGTVLQPTRVATTGILQIDRAVAVILSNDVAARRGLIRYTTAGCTHEPGMGGPPKCEPGQAEGAEPVEQKGNLRDDRVEFERLRTQTQE